MQNLIDTVVLRPMGQFFSSYATGESPTPPNDRSQP
jgi:hypothetical protein